MPTPWSRLRPTEVRPAPDRPYPTPAPALGGGVPALAQRVSAVRVPYRAGRSAARRAALRAVERELARYLGIGFLGLLYRVLDQEAARLVTGPGRPARRTMPTCVLRNRWSSVDGWLGTLGRERRVSIRRYARKIEADPSLVVTAGAGRTDLDPHELAELLRRHRDRLGIPRLDTRSHVAGAYLDAFVRRPDVHTLTYRDAGGRLLALNTLIDHPVSAVLQHWAALPVGEGGRYNLYFDCYLRCVRHMIDNGRAELSAGRGLSEVKSSLGFGLQDRSTVIVPRPVVGR